MCYHAMRCLRVYCNRTQLSRTGRLYNATCHRCDQEATLEDGILYLPGVALFICILQQADQTTHSGDDHLLAAMHPGYRYCAIVLGNKLVQDLTGCFNAGSNKEHRTTAGVGLWTADLGCSLAED